MTVGPEVTILLLGDAEVGKSTFLSRLSLGVSDQQQQQDALPPPPPPPPYILPVLRDSEQPYEFDVRLYNRPYRLRFFDTASPTHYTCLQPDVVILCYDISSRASLRSLSSTWLAVMRARFEEDERLAVMMLGLKRDLRKQWTQAEMVAPGADGKGSSVMPHEAVQMAQKMLCDCYAECSALTGELCRQVLEDIAKMCAKTTTQAGGKSPGPNLCSTM